MYAHHRPFFHLMIAAALIRLPGFVGTHGAERHPRLLARVEIAGMAWPRDELPEGLTLNRELGVIVPGEFVKVQAVGPYYAYGSRDESGRSDGYVAGGGPGYPETLDTVGRTSRFPRTGR